MDLNVSAGYRGLREHAAWIDLSARGKIRIAGEDRARLLHAMCTNQIELLHPGEGCYAFFLNAQGRILADANILCFEGGFLLDTEPETREKILEHLDRYVIADDVTLSDVTDQWNTFAVEGPEAGSVLGLDLDPYSWTAQDSGTAQGIKIVARLNSTGSDGFFIFAPRGESGGFAIPRASAEDARIVRIENGRPRYGEEITERNLAAETDQMRAIHFNKGCYLGQEIVERVRSRAQIHRILRRLTIDTKNPPAAGYKNDRAEIASAVFSPALGKTAALAYVRTQFAEPGMELNIDGCPAVVSNARSLR